MRDINERGLVVVNVSSGLHSSVENFGMILRLLTEESMIVLVDQAIVRIKIWKLSEKMNRKVSVYGGIVDDLNRELITLIVYEDTHDQIPIILLMDLKVNGVLKMLIEKGHSVWRQHLTVLVKNNGLNDWQRKVVQHQIVRMSDVNKVGWIVVIGHLISEETHLLQNIELF